MDKYRRLVEKHTDENGIITYRCSFYETPECIDPTHNCASCAMTQYILSQLYIFEEIYTKGEEA